MEDSNKSDPEHFDEEEVNDSYGADFATEDIDPSQEEAQEHRSLYEVLGVKPDADIEEIRERYRVLAREFHPDLNPTHHDIGLFIKVRRTYEILKDKKKRAEYDKTLGIYHSKINGGGFLKETSHQILRDKLESGEDEEAEEKAKLLPQFAYFKKQNEPKSVFDKILRIFKKEEDVPTHTLDYIKTKTTKKDDDSAPQRQREYLFSITPLESILGTERIIVLGENLGEQKTIKVKIPSGINNNSILKIFHPDRGTIPIKILFHEHPDISREGNNVILNVPIAPTEENLSLDVYTCQSKYHINIPAGSTKAIKLHEEGLRNKKTDTVGDFIVQPIRGNEKAAVERIRILKLLEPLHHHD